MKLSPLPLALCILVGCSSSGDVTETYESGQMGSEAYMLDGALKDGLWSTWHENGQMRAKGQFKNGKGEGLWIYWEEDGQLGATGQWKEGRRDGRWADWHENGAMKSVGLVKNGQREGLWTYWRENGVQQAEGPFVLDRREGAWTFWDEDHDVKAAGMYAEGQRVGDWHFAPEGLREKKDAVRARAETLLQLLRDEQWEDAADFVLVDETTRRYLGISEGAGPEVRREKVARLYEGMYGSRGPSSLPQFRYGPGHVRSVRIDPKDPDLAHVSYRHGDLDGFEMRLAEGEWYYSFE
jgi:antitoxin component YwqK of YwqJK toxin-antitoxin module